MCLSCCSWQLKNAETVRNLHNSCHHVSSLLDTRCLAKCFRHYSALSKNRRSKSFSKKLYTSMTKKKEEAQTKSRYQGIDHRRRQNVVKTSVTHSPATRVPFLCFYHILTSSVSYYWTDARQHGIYLLKSRFNDHQHSAFVYWKVELWLRSPPLRCYLGFLYILHLASIPLPPKGTQVLCFKMFLGLKPSVESLTGLIFPRQNVHWSRKATASLGSILNIM